MPPFSVVKLGQGQEFVKYMEKYYSMRFKDGYILRSNLTVVESRRFRSAAYLFCQYQIIWQKFQYFHRDPKNQGCTQEESDAQDARTTEACLAFVSSLSTQQICWLQEFCEFLLHDIDYTMDLKHNYNAFSLPALFASNHHGHDFSFDAWRHHLLSVPFVASFRNWANVMLAPDTAPTRLERDSLWLTDSLSRLLNERISTSEAKVKAGFRILDSKGILVKACQKCGIEPHGSMELYNKTDIEGVESLWDIENLPGHLGQNPIEFDRIVSRVHGSDSQSFDSSDDEDSERNKNFSVIREILAHAEAQARARLENNERQGDGLELSDDEEADESEAENETPKVYRWNLDDPLCEVCFTEEFRNVYYAWWLDERQTDRVKAHPFLEQCWWGYECRTQRRESHATKLDHCCPKTKGVIS
ncbi:hypothetical protein M408DRAFT_326456 [Serendipita vermifera MAFF 305830]|uniref:Aprataxin and PNK-like factor PBZ domain-containing protein n=1 Tax=Serendipita vermifera MAFF 305830 TaxID=933852 RepID=A0A0C3B7B5_SERVB|nr:hypothetical protein M408DRAFT_326456 [Serendipita vermifera MAFF 305830]